MLRSINQDEARLDAINTLDAHSVLLVIDWAMKYLPRKYRESQTDGLEFEREEFLGL